MPSTHPVAIVCAAALLLAAAACDGLDSDARPSPSVTATVDIEPSCEAEDIAEGDYLQDCYGLPGAGKVTPGKTASGRSTTAPSCKSGYRPVRGKCVKK